MSNALLIHTLEEVGVDDPADNICSSGQVSSLGLNSRHLNMGIPEKI
jgi:hypothetical protein